MTIVGVYLILDFDFTIFGLDDALLLVTAARMGLIPRFRRRLDMVEQRTLITSGAIFLWNEEESSMKRWTDGFPWSPSRIQHKFLVFCLFFVLGI